MKLMILGSLLALSCGNDSSKQQASPSAPTADGEEIASSDEPTYTSIKLNSKKDLPECTDELIGSLAYVTNDKAFYVCEENTWAKTELGTSSAVQAVEVVDASEAECPSGGKVIVNGDARHIVCSGTNGEDGIDGVSTLNIVGKWYYFNSNLGAAIDVNKEGSDLTYISTINVTEFDSGYIYLTVIGHYLESDISQVYDFTHSNFVDISDDNSGIASFKLYTYLNSVIYYYYDNETNRVLVSVDVNGDVSDNPTSEVFQLSEYNF